MANMRQARDLARELVKVRALISNRASSDESSRFLLFFFFFFSHTAIDSIILPHDLLLAFFRLSYKKKVAPKKITFFYRLAENKTGAHPDRPRRRAPRGAPHDDLDGGSGQALRA